jgi:ABC-2 type transport system ATP-binding protein
MNFISPDEGSIKILDRVVDLNSRNLRNSVGYLPSANSLYVHWTVKEHLDFVSALRAHKPDYSLAKKLDLDIRAKVESLSTGNRQKLMIAMAMIGSPELLILDEPTKGLDPIMQNQLYALLTDHCKNGGTVFMSSHNLPEVEQVCDAIAVIKDGRIIVEETLESVRRKSIHEVSVIFKRPVDDNLFKSLDVEVLNHHGAKFDLKVKGDLEPVLSVVHTRPITDMTITHASLEEIFLEMYR